MAIQSDISSGATSYGVGSPASYGSAALGTLSTGLNALLGTDFGLSGYSESYADALDREYNAEQAQINRDFNSSEAQKQRDFEERMSNTSYQRAIDDMQKAGINPILAFQHGGASTPSGSAASGSAASGSRKGSYSFSDGRDKLLGIAKIVAGAYTNNPGISASGFMDVFVHHGNGVKTHERKYK